LVHCFKGVQIDWGLLKGNWFKFGAVSLRLLSFIVLLFFMFCARLVLLFSLLCHFGIVCHCISQSFISQAALVHKRDSHVGAELRDALEMNFGFTNDFLNEDVLERVKDVFFLFVALVFCVFSLNRLSFLTSRIIVSENVMSDALVRSEHLVDHEFASLARVDKLNYLRSIGVNVIPSI